MKIAAQEKQTAEEGAMRQRLEKLYTDCAGDVKKIFDKLQEDPGKALKYPPADAAEFARKYLAGGFSYL